MVSPGTVEPERVTTGPISLVLAGVALVWIMVRPAPFLQPLREQLHDLAGRFLRRHARRFVGFADPYLTVTVAEHDSGVDHDGRMRRGEAYELATAYLGDRCSRQARQLRAVTAPASAAAGGGGEGGDRLVMPTRILGDGDEVADEFRGATVWWSTASPAKSNDQEDGGRGVRAYQLVFHRRHRDLVVGSYLPHVFREGRRAAMAAAGRRRKLFTNAGNLGYPLFHARRFDSCFAAIDAREVVSIACTGGRRGGTWRSSTRRRSTRWQRTPVRKKEIMDDLDAFRNGEEYYKRVGKAWKRGYLLHGPPGTGKSSMIAAMANYLEYDVELASVSTNTDLRNLFIETTGKPIIVIELEDVDCSLDLTGKRRREKLPEPGTGTGTAAATDGDGDNEATKKKRKGPEHGDEERKKVTLSGVLNFIDGLWMDKHIELSYCYFESFKFLAKNYLAVDDQYHPLFGAVEEMLREVEMTPADVAENLTPKGPGDDADWCLAALVKALQEAKEKAMEEIMEDE
ncbi:unnamed protein product [Urochloa decumbens]|uniref:AAA+ ATPase domain-containing protein n=1 Tax=Urochloa decumbens TaxID=240449 RepID=A0ABC9EYR1_9POAL